MANTVTILDTSDDVDVDVLVRLGDRFVSPAAAQLHIFGVLLGAHLGQVGLVPDADFATLPPELQYDVHELLEAHIWRRTDSGYRIDPDHAIRTMRESLDRLDDPKLCVATGSDHVRGEDGGCTRCGTTRV